MSEPAFRPWTIAAAVFLVSVCMSPIALVQPILQTAGHGALLWYLLGIPTAALGTLLNIWLVEEPLGSWGQRVSSYLQYLRVPFYLLGATAMLTVWLNILSDTEMPETPRFVLSLVTIGVVTYSLRLGIEATTRLVGLLGVIVLPGLLLLVLSTAPEGHISWLLPDVLGGGQVPWTWPLIVFMPRGYDILPVLLRQASGDVRRPTLLAAVTAAVYLAVSMILPVLVFGFAGASQLAYPFLRAIGVVSSSFIPFQRIAFVSFIIWEMICFAIVAIYSVSGLHSLGMKVHPLTPWSALLPWVAAVFVMSLYILTMDQIVLIKVIWSTYGLVVFLVLPALILAFGRKSRVALTA